MVVALRYRESGWSVRRCWYYATGEHHCQSEFTPFWYCRLLPMWTRRYETTSKV